MQEEWSLQPGTTTPGLSVLPSRVPADSEKKGEGKKRDRLRKHIICDPLHLQLTLFESFLVPQILVWYLCEMGTSADRQVMACGKYGAVEERLADDLAGMWKSGKRIALEIRSVVP